MLLPALVLLVAFTHYPAVATIIDSFMSTPKPNRPSVFVGLDNYVTMVEDPIFWQALRNNLWFALTTIPMSVGLALAMALRVNGRMAGRGFFAYGVFHADRVADDCRGQYLVFFYTPTYGLLEQIGGLFGLPSQNWLGDKSTALASGRTRASS